MRVPVVLIVEDDADQRTLLQDVLTGSGFRVLTANDGRQALTLLGAFRPDVLLVDVQMPNIDGVTLLRMVKPEGIPAVLLTAQAANALPPEAATAAAVITKPPDTHRLVTLLKALAVRQ